MITAQLYRYSRLFAQRFFIPDGSDWILPSVAGPRRTLETQNGELVAPEGVRIYHPVKQCLETPYALVGINGTFSAKIGNTLVEYGEGDGCWDYLPFGRTKGKAVGDLEYVCVGSEEAGIDVKGQIIKIDSAGETATVAVSASDDHAIIVCKGRALIRGQEIEEMTLVNISSEAEITALTDGMIAMSLAF